MSKKKKRDNSKIGTGVLIAIVIGCVILGAILIKDYFLKMNKAIFYSDKILKIYTNSK